MTKAESRIDKIQAATFQLREQLERWGVAMIAEPIDRGDLFDIRGSIDTTASAPPAKVVRAVTFSIPVVHQLNDRSTILALASEIRRRVLVAVLESPLWNADKERTRQIVNVILSLEAK